MIDAPLPPFVSIPRPEYFRTHMRRRIPDELRSKRLKENEYVILSVLTITSGLVGCEAERCVELVRSLVGEVGSLGYSEEVTQSFEP